MTDQLLRNRCPYTGINWDHVEQIQGTTHVHCTETEEFDALIAQGLGFATLANYYPSAPWYPAHGVYRNFFRISQQGYT